ncbi:hypothetical protein AF71_00060830 [Rhizobium sp. 57MFTsu3.2]|nr:hypothetical protein [Rhizobium sp. 57MFTsu3.2]
MTTSDVLWNIPVNVRLQNGTEKSFQSVHDTLDFLENEWRFLLRQSCRYCLMTRSSKPSISKNSLPPSGFLICASRCFT